MSGELNHCKNSHLVSQIKISNLHPFVLFAHSDIHAYPYIYIYTTDIHLQDCTHFNICLK